MIYILKSSQNEGFFIAQRYKVSYKAWLTFLFAESSQRLFLPTPRRQRVNSQGLGKEGKSFFDGRGLLQGY